MVNDIFDTIASNMTFELYLVTLSDHLHLGQKNAPSFSLTTWQKRIAFIFLQLAHLASPERWGVGGCHNSTELRQRRSLDDATQAEDLTPLQTQDQTGSRNPKPRTPGSRGFNAPAAATIGVNIRRNALDCRGTRGPATCGISTMQLSQGEAP